MSTFRISFEVTTNSHPNLWGPIQLPGNVGSVTGWVVEELGVEPPPFILEFDSTTNTYKALFSNGDLVSLGTANPSEACIHAQGYWDEVVCG